MKRDVDEETKEIIVSFIAEGYERLDDAEVQLGKLGGADDIPCLNSVFRLFHSVKGSAGYLGFEAIKALTHEAEALLEVFLKEKVAPTQDSLDVIYSTIDMLRTLIKTVESDMDDEAGAAAAQVQAAAITEAIMVLHASKVEAKPGIPENRIVLSPLVNRDMVMRFIAECADLAEGAERVALGLMQAQDKAEAVNSIFRAIHTIKGNSGFFGYAYLESLCMQFEGFLDGARKGTVPVGEGLVNTIIERVDLLRAAMGSLAIVEEGEAAAKPAATSSPAAQPSQPVAKPSSSQSAQAFPAPAIEATSSQAASPAAPVAAPSEPPSAPAAAPPSAPAAAPSPPSAGATPTGAAPGEARYPPPLIEPEGDLEYQPLGEILVDLGAAKEEDVRKALDLQEKPLGEILVETGKVKPEDLSKALDLQKQQGAPAERTAERPQIEEIQRKEIRVDTGKLDKLFDLVGELITAEAMVLNSPDLSGLKLDSFQKSFAGLNKISREIQETTMMIRMIPLESLFQKMTRLVRDLSRKSGKPIDFRVTGQETEMDKNVIEQISDPLVHIIRNAIDHGIEGGEGRAAAGKPTTGSIHLGAKYEGSEIWITVKDDGQGLNRERIVAKGLEKGLIKGDPSTLPDKDVWSLIFEPGFSTAAKVTEVSGRGVGMDVVKKNLENIRGKVDIHTEAGQGTEFVLKIPLTMAIIDGITVRAGASFYSIPLGDILEFFKAAPVQLTVTERGGEAVNLRGAILPLLKLGEVYGIAGATLDALAGIIIVVQSAGRKACLLIDEVVGNQQIVVKSLSEYLGKVEGVSGCSILGDGTVSFIIDTGRLMSLRLE